jgi:hypothetical protein
MSMILEYRLLLDNLQLIKLRDSATPCLSKLKIYDFPQIPLISAERKSANRHNLALFMSMILEYRLLLDNLQLIKLRDSATPCLSKLKIYDFPQIPLISAERKSANRHNLALFTGPWIMSQRGF